MRGHNVGYYCQPSRSWVNTYAHGRDCERASSDACRSMGNSRGGCLGGASATERKEPSSLPQGMDPGRKALSASIRYSRGSNSGAARAYG
jgi:hypothetical protein